MGLFIRFSNGVDAPAEVVEQHQGEDALGGAAVGRLQQGRDGDGAAGAEGPVQIELYQPVGQVEQGDGGSPAGMVLRRVGERKGRADFPAGSAITAWKKPTAASVGSGR